MGLSPRTRGNRVRVKPFNLSKGSIPAPSGEPCEGRLLPLSTWVYPRARGGTNSLPCCRPLLMGLSPRTRGNRHPFDHAGLPEGSIPAHAGEPNGCPHRRMNLGVYPRARGGTPQQTATPLGGLGLSPRTRGNLRPSSICAYRSGSIPAHAGEPVTDPL